MSTKDLPCPDCGSDQLNGPDFEGFFDCRNCGAAWIPQRAESGWFEPLPGDQPNEPTQPVAGTTDEADVWREEEED